MAFDLVVPGLGESVSEAVIAKWVKNDGDTVGPEDVVVELETDKATIELPAGKAGVIKTSKPKGATVKVGDVIAAIETSAVGAAKPVPAAVGAGASGGDGKSVDLSPAVRALLAEHGLSASQIPATGPKGNITTEDVLNYVARQKPLHAGDTQHTQKSQQSISATPTVPSNGTTSQPDRTKSGTAVGQPTVASAGVAPVAPIPTGGGEEVRIEMSKLRQTIANRLVAAQHATASLTTFNEIDMSAVMSLREKYKEKFEKTYGIGLGFMSFFAKAVIYALKALPNVNGSIDGTAIIQRKYVNLGIAVSTERGLMVPVLRNAEKMSMATIESEIKRLATKARDGKISPDDMAGGTFTITNGGVFGSLLSTPILNPPQSGILGMHKIEKRAVVVSEDGEDKIVIRPMMYVALTYDHRIIDGQQSVTFLVKIKEALEDPARLLIEI
jgi:2-oxoglutarate dehydrogenase E2 component (dihydrolipoamide succinyltransferase)